MNIYVQGDPYANIQAPEGQNLMLVARENGIFIPSLCYYEHIEPPLGTCRTCTCKINGKYGPACTEKVHEGLTVEVDSAELNDPRKALVEMMFAEGNHICPACEKSGNCDLQHMGYELGIAVTRFPHLFKDRIIDDKPSRMVMEHNRCIKCKRCVEEVFTDEGKRVFNYMNRGNETFVGVDYIQEAKLSEAQAINAMKICPTGAIIVRGVSMTAPFGDREFDQQSTQQKKILKKPKIATLLKLNTNENPSPPSPKVLAAIQAELGDDAARLRLYPDPNADLLKAAIARTHEVSPQQVFVGNGSDEVLAHVFMALLKHDTPILFPDITYSFYPVYCGLYDVDYQTVPLADDFTINPADYCGKLNGGILFPNPNAPTGRLLALDAIERIAQANPDSVVDVDEAYVDFGGSTAIQLIGRYDNLLVVHTLSKSRSLAGMRVGFAVGHPALIEALERVKNSFNSYPLLFIRPVPGSSRPSPIRRSSSRCSLNMVRYLGLARSILPRMPCMPKSRRPEHGCCSKKGEKMESVLITALAFMTFLCLLLGWAGYRLFTDREKSMEHEASRRKEWMDERKEMDRYLSGVLRVLNPNVGGISKRISESAEIAEAIQSTAPDLFKRCDGLAYWLHANDQFLVSLSSVAAEGIDRDHRRRVHEMKKTGREEVFGRIYEGAGLSAPSLRIEPCPPIS